MTLLECKLKFSVILRKQDKIVELLGYDYLNNHIIASKSYFFIYMSESVKAAAVKRLPFLLGFQGDLGFSYGVKMASTLSTLSTILKKRYLYILHVFYKPSTIFYKMKKNIKPSTKYFNFYSISTIVETYISHK